MKNFLSAFFALYTLPFFCQFIPKGQTPAQQEKARRWADSTYLKLSQDERLGQLFIIALYTNRGEEAIQKVQQIAGREKIGGLILMQEDAARHITLVNEMQKQAKIPLLIGMDAEWGLYQRIAAAHKFPWALTLGAIQDKNLIYEMSRQIAEDAKRMGVAWDFAPAVDVNTNPANPIIGNRSFGSAVPNVISSASAYAKGLQENGVLAAIKHFPGHGDTDTDSHLDLPMVGHSLERLNAVELAPFRALANSGIGGVMVAHLYVPALEPQKGIPASLSFNIITKLLRNQMGYRGLIITDALNMNAVASRFAPGEVDALAFKAGNDLMLFSQDVATGKKLIQQAIDKGEIPQSRVEESVKKILLTKYYLGLMDRKPASPENIIRDLNSEKHQVLAQKLYAHALTLIKDHKKLLPLSCTKTYYYVPLEEASHQTFLDYLESGTRIIKVRQENIGSIPARAVVIVGLHKDNSTAYKPYAISKQSQDILQQLAARHRVLLNVFGSPYALKEVDLDKISTVLVSYENNPDSQAATARALLGRTTIDGRLPVTVNEHLKEGTGMDLNAKNK